MTDDRKALVPAGGEFLVYVADGGASRVHVEIADGTVWLTQRQMSELYCVSVPTVNEHLQNVHEAGELGPGVTTRKFRMVRTEARHSAPSLRQHLDGVP